MKLGKTLRLLEAAAAFVFAFLLARAVATNDDAQQRPPPLQIFLMAGQSNMVGMGSIAHLLDLIDQTNGTTASDSNNNNNKHNNEYRDALWDETSSTFRVRNNVFLKYETVFGNLTVRPGFAGRDSFGPELMFGWMVGDSNAVQQQNILLIKTAWGGKNLAIDFRPPLSGQGTFPNVKPIQYGWLYRQMIEDILETLQNVGKYVPDYKEEDGYELAGFVWFQGWNDMLNAPFVAEYVSTF
jgi:hypothetical protein